MKHLKKLPTLREMYEKRLDCKKDVEGLLAALDRQRATYAAEGKHGAFWKRRNRLVEQLGKIEDDLAYYVKMGWNE